MLDSLKSGLRAAIKKIVSSGAVDEALIKELAKDVQRALLQSDVNVKFVFEITKNLEERSLKETPPPGLSRKDHIVKILYDELAKFLTKQGYRVAVIGADTYRPGALTQLRTMCEKANAEVYGEESNKDSP